MEADDARVVVRISNTGPGIPTEERPHVFERFHRGAEARHWRRDGHGLGLSLAREILLAHQGELTLVASDPSLTLFRVSLPALPPES